MTVYTGTDLCCNDGLVSKHRRWKWLLLFLLGLLALLLFALQQMGIGSLLPQITAPISGETIGVGELTLKGVGQPDSAVQLLCNDAVLGDTDIGSDGSWSFATNVENPDTCEYQAIALDNNNNIRAGAVSNVVKYAAPALAIGGMAIGAGSNLIKPALALPTGDLQPGSFNISGSAMPDSELQFLVDGEISGQTTVDASGNWAYDVELAEAREYNLTADTLYDNGDVAISSDKYSLMLSAGAVAAVAAGGDNTGGDNTGGDNTGGDAAGINVAAAEPTTYFVRETSTATVTPQGGIPTREPTSTPIPATDTPEPTDTPIPATDTPEPTDTPIPATDTPEPTVEVAVISEPAGPPIGGYIWLDLDGNGLRDEDEPPNIISMPITLTGEDGDSQTVDSDSDGYFEFADVAPGTYDIKFLKPAAFNFTLNNASDDALGSAVQVLDPEGAPNEGSATIEVVEGEQILVSAGLTLGVGINMELVVSDDLVCAGDAVTVQMYTRLLNASQGIQLRNIQIYNTDLGDDADIRGTYFVAESDLNGNGYLDWLDLDGEENLAPNGDKRSDEEFIHEYTREFYETTIIQSGDQADVYFSNNPNDPAAGTSLDQTISADDSVQITVVNPKLGITVLPSSNAVATGEEAVFNVTVLNSGDVDITELQLSHSTATQCDQIIEKLAAGESRQYTCSFPELTSNRTLQVQAQGKVGDDLCMVSNESKASIAALAQPEPLVEPTAAPPTAAPPTAAPPTPTYTPPPTAVPPTAATPTYTPPPTAVHPTAAPTLAPPEVLPKTGPSLEGMSIQNVIIPLFGLLLIGLVGLFENRRKQDEM